MTIPLSSYYNTKTRHHLPPPIRALCGPGLPFRGFHFRLYCKKRCSFTHFFKKRVFREIYAKRSYFLRVIKRKWTLMEGKTHRCWGGSTVKRKRTPVLGIDHSGPGPGETCNPQNSLLRRRPPLHERVMLSIIAQIRGISAHIFWETSEWDPFG